MATRASSRPNAGVNRKLYDEETYSLVSFKGLSKAKHALIPSRNITNDVLDDRLGSIKLQGKPREVSIIGSGSRGDMQEKSSRYADQADSEEVELTIEDEETKDEPIDHFADGRTPGRSTISKDQPYMPPPSNVLSLVNLNDSTPNRRTQQASATRAPVHTTASNLQDTDNHNYDQLYGEKNDNKRQREPSSPLTSSNEDDNDVLDEENSPSVRKKLKSTTVRPGFSFLDRAKKPANKRKQKQGEQTEQTRNNDDRLTRLENEVLEIPLLKAKIARMQRAISNVQRQRAIGKAHLLRKSVVPSELVGDGQPPLNRRIKDVFGIDPSVLRSSSHRPTLLVRELFRKSGHVDDCDIMFTEHKELLQEFVGRPNNISEDSDEQAHFDLLWTTVESSMRQLKRDCKSNSKKKVPSTTSSNIDPQQVTTNARENQEATGENE